MAELLPDSSSASRWAESIVDIAGPDRANTRWDGSIMVIETDRMPSVTTSESGINGLQYYLFMLREHVDAVQQAAEQGTAEQRQERWDTLVEATGYVTSQATGLLTPLADMHPVGQADADLNGGLADVWTQERLQYVWQNSDSAGLMSADDVPAPHFDYAGRGPAADATRDVLTEIAGQNGQEPSSGDFVDTCDDLIRMKPDDRWATLVAKLPGGDKLSRDERMHLGHRLRTQFKSAVDARNPGSGTPESPATVATRKLAAAVRTTTDGRTGPFDDRAAELAKDPALRSPTPGRTPGSDEASAQPRPSGVRAVLRSLRSGHDRGGRH
ncbi:hypothetical protein JOF29_001097 [Kribbella aluminosa]|uniref:Uncharacterized protein n=1 Tax=Kribbella aluminosa TaxID=416017 RepID=A0ABS4UEE4_9ACTN|nr:hypothetical protein [Kribbella aluminosa]MBP2350014.1 hypothetical protein [Kribbella aluminosa]